MINNINKRFWAKKKVFITGHTGFKGSWLSIFLTYLGAEVTGYSLKPLTRPSLFNLANIKKLIKKSIIADIRDYHKLHKEIKKSNASIIFHLAAQPLVRMSYIHPKDTFDINFSGTLNILQIIKKINKIKTGIIITTDKVYDIKKNKIFKETDALGGLDPYSSSKVCAEHVFTSYKNSFFKNLNLQRLATVRAGNVIGGGDYSEDRLYYHDADTPGQKQLMHIGVYWDPGMEFEGEQWDEPFSGTGKRIIKSHVFAYELDKLKNNKDFIFLDP